MTKTICDICGKDMITAKIVEDFKNLNFCISSNGRIWDICTECRKNLDKWITIRRTESEDNG